MGRTAAIPADRTRCRAIGVAAQFELLLRLGEIVGGWGDARVDQLFPPEEHSSPALAHDDVEVQVRVAAEFDLTSYSLLFPLLDAVSRDECADAFAKDEHSLPIARASYRK